MERKILKNKPLLETIFELRWKLLEEVSNVRIDPNYKLLIGRIYDRVKEEYPYYEKLPTASMPEEIAGYIIQHRFRKDKDNWPRIQIGPGIVSLNSTEGYSWEDFEKRIINVLDVLYNSYLNAEAELMINGLLLRYIDAIDFNFEEEDILLFLNNNLKIKIDLQPNLFEGDNVKQQPQNIDLRFSFPLQGSEGFIHLRFARGKIKASDALIWETMVQLKGPNVPNSKENIINWVKDAHDLTDDWFFKLIEGNLLKRFE